MSTSQQRSALLDDLYADAKLSYKSGRLNNITDVLLSIIAIFGSLSATVLASVETKEKWIVALIASLPAACAALQRIVDFKGRSNWYFKYNSNINALVNELRFARAPDVSDFARKWGELDVEMTREWAQIGREGAKPSIGSQLTRGKAAIDDERHDQE